MDAISALYVFPFLVKNQDVHEDVYKSPRAYLKKTSPSLQIHDYSLQTESLLAEKTYMNACKKPLRFNGFRIPCFAQVTNCRNTLRR